MAQLTARDRPVRDCILDAAERLYAQHGFDGVSLRQISAEAGTRNHYAVQMHFGDADGLIRAIVARRAAEQETARGRLLAKLVGNERATLRQLLEVLYRPIIDGGQPGQPSILSRFYLALLTTPRGWEPLYAMHDDNEIARRTLELITDCNAPIPPPITWRRTLYAGVSLLASAVAACTAGESEEFYRAAVADAFEMAAAALAAPTTESLPMLSDKSRAFIV
jgi:AcrR family transcriptional regulator